MSSTSTACSLQGIINAKINYLYLPTDGTLCTRPKNQNYAIQFDGVVEEEGKSLDDLNYVYKLSTRSIRIIGQDNYPKIDHFLNQILR